jgi:hypothetical protein
MKIKLIMDVPVRPEHNMHKGRVLEVIEKSYSPSPRNPDLVKQDGVWVQGSGERVKILNREYSVIEDTPHAK